VPADQVPTAESGCGAAHGAGVPGPEFHSEIIAELARLRANDTGRAVGSLAVCKSADGDLQPRRDLGVIQVGAVAAFRADKFKYTSVHLSDI
jgi:hypothetical protein